MQEGNQFQNFNTQNFDPLSLANQTQSVIMCAFVSDVSPSISSYASAMTNALRDIVLGELRTCHRKDDIVIKSVAFCEKVTHRSGFSPVLSLPDHVLDVAPTGGGTALYQAVAETMEDVIAYRKDLEAQGIDVRTCVYITTDGEDNCDSKGSYAAKIRKMVDELRQNEAWVSSFTINMLGVGNDANFRAACVEMGLDPDKCLDQISTSAHDIRKHMGVVSQSISSSNAGAVVSF